jgi:hypothetical protein
MLDALKAGQAVVVQSYELLSAFSAAELPHAGYDRFCFGGPDYKKRFILNEHNLLCEYAPD